MSAPSPYTTAGRTGKSYGKFLQQNANFDPWSNLDQFAGAGAGNDPIIAQAFGWTNEWARNNGWGDGARIPLQQRQQIFMANLERARQQWTDNAANPGARQGVTWDTSLARNIPNEGWAYQTGGTPSGGSWELPQGNSQPPPATSTTVNPGTPAAPAAPAPVPAPAPAAPAPPTLGPTTTNVAPGLGPSIIPGVAGGAISPSTGARNIALKDPKAALDYVMQGLGVNTDRPGLFTDQIQEEMGRMLDPYLQLADVYGKGDSDFAYGDNPEYLLQQFAQNFKGGHGYQGLARMANNISADPRWEKDILGSLGAKAGANAMQNRMFLSNAGTNPLYNQARAARWAAAFGDRDHLGAFGRASVDNPNLMPVDWLRASPWADLLNNY